MLVSGCKKEDDYDRNTVTDIDGNVYNTVTIGDQVWMAENLKTTKYSDGTTIRHVTPDNEWINLRTGAYSWYDNDFGTYGSLYGGLYNWYAVASRKLCPAGWRVPTDDDWTQLTDYLIDNYEDITFSNLGNSLRSCRQVDSPLGGDYDTDEHPRWNSHFRNYGTDEFGFSALPGGLRYYYDGSFINIGSHGYWWSSTERQHTNAWIRLIYNADGDMRRSSSIRWSGLSVRCIKN